MAGDHRPHFLTPLRRTLALVAALGPALLTGSLSGEENRLVDYVTSAVGPTAICRSQVVFESRLLLVQKGLYWRGRLPKDLLTSVQERLIAKELIYLDLVRARPTPGPEETAEGPALREEFRRLFPDPDAYEDFLRAMGLSESSLTAYLVRDRRIDRHMERRLKLLSQVSDAEVDQELKRLAGTEGGGAATPGEERQFREAVRRRLEKQKLKTALEGWLTDLSERFPIHRLVPFETDEPALYGPLAPSTEAS